MKLEQLVALAELSARWHNGMSSRLYRIGCRASKIAWDRYGISGLLDVRHYTKPELHTKINRYYRKYYRIALPEIKN